MALDRRCALSHNGRECRPERAEVSVAPALAPITRRDGACPPSVILTLYASEHLCYNEIAVLYGIASGG